MADEHSEADAHGGDDGEADTNGTASAGNLWSSFQERAAAAKAEFLAGGIDTEAGDEKPAAKTESKPSKPSETASDDDEDLDDDDLDDQDEDEETVDKDESDDEEDPDKDLDEDDDEPAEKPDAEVAKRLDQVRKTDKRLREQREAHFKSEEQRLQRIEAAIQERWKPRIEAAEEFEKLKSRKGSPFDTLKALGYDEADFSDMLREGWALYGEGAKDPKYKDAVAKLRKDREQAARVAELEKKLEHREKTETEKAQEAEQRRNVEVFIGKVATLAAKSEKTPLVKQYLKADPERAKLELEIVGGRLAQKLGRMPDPKDVMIEFEKEQRRTLRRLGFDPKTRAAAAAAPETKNASTKNGAKPASKTTPAADEAKKKPVNLPLSREEFIRGPNGN